MTKSSLLGSAFAACVMVAVPAGDAYAKWKKSDQTAVRSVVAGLVQRMGSDGAVARANASTAGAKPKAGHPEVCTGPISPTTAGGAQPKGEFVPAKRKKNPGTVLLNFDQVNAEHPLTGAKSSQLQTVANAFMRAAVVVEEFHHAGQNMKLAKQRKRLCMPDFPAVMYATPLPSPPTAPTPTNPTGNAADLNKVRLYLLLKLAADAEVAFYETDAKYHRLCNFHKILPPKPAGVSQANYVKTWKILNCDTYRQVCHNLREFDKAIAAFNKMKAAYTAAGGAATGGSVGYKSTANKPKETTINPQQLSTYLAGLSTATMKAGKKGKKDANAKVD